jgi:PleD family two-component response regulator
MTAVSLNNETNQLLKGKVLIVDDDEVELMEFSDFFDSEGFKTFGVTNGETAISKAIEFSPDVILLDVMMPGMNGYEACRRLKAAQATMEIPVIFVTGLSDTKDKLRGFEAGGVDYVTKPFEIEEISARVSAHVALQRLKKEREGIIRELSEALDTVKKLEGMLPICMFCKKIRNDKGYWEQVELYISEHSDVRFSHGLCEECSKKHYSELHADKLA